MVISLSQGNALGKCDLAYSPTPPRLVQIDTDLVFVNWVETHQEKEFVAVKLSHWAKDTPSYGAQIKIADINYDFTYVSVEEGKSFSFQLFVLIEGKIK